MTHAGRYAALAIILSSAMLAAPPVLRQSGDLTLVEPSGKQVSLAGYTGKVVLVQFLHTTCPHCQAAARLYNKLQKEYGPRGLQVTGVAFNDEAEGQPDVVRSFAESNGVEFPVGVARKDTVLNYLGISVLSRFAVPQIVIIDRKGVIREQSPSAGGGPLGDTAHLKQMIETLLAEGAPAKGPAKSGSSTAKPGEKKATDKKTSE